MQVQGQVVLAAGCQVIMNLHNEVVEEKLVRVYNRPYLAFRYVDDERFHVKGIKPGWRWERKTMAMVYRSYWQEKDIRYKLTTTVTEDIESIQTQVKLTSPSPSPSPKPQIQKGKRDFGL